MVRNQKSVEQKHQYTDSMDKGERERIKKVKTCSLTDSDDATVPFRKLKVRRNKTNDLDDGC
jgi:hypothetical protein